MRALTSFLMTGVLLALLLQPIWHAYLIGWMLGWSADGDTWFHWVTLILTVIAYVFATPTSLFFVWPEFIKYLGKKYLND